MAGTFALARGLMAPTGMLTEAEPTEGLRFPAAEEIVFGGHEVRNDSPVSALERLRREGLFLFGKADELARPLGEVTREIVPGTCRGLTGDLLESALPESRGDRTLKETADRLETDMKRFRDRHGLDRVVVVNLASTEPAPPPGSWGRDIESFENALEADTEGKIPASCLYARAAIRAGFPYVEFTPSTGATIPALLSLAETRGVPHAGRDGKTGETLVKSALAPMFRMRALKVLSWQGYNMLGNMDGKVLSDPRARESKLRSKESLLPAILGYPVHSHVGIDYVPSLGDWKEALDHVHFEGFAGTKMSLQFTWRGSDSALAAPLVIDLVRWAWLAAQRNESGVMRHLALYFKEPLGDAPADLPGQWRLLKEYVSGLGARLE